MVPTETRVLVLLHPDEQQKPTNTGHLVRLLLPNSEVRRWEPRAPLPADSDRPTALLFPRPGAAPIASAPPPCTLVVPDGAWRQTRRMVSRPPLSSIPALALPEGPAPSQRLRRVRTDDHRLATLDAVARALGILECQYVEDQMRALLDRVVVRGLYSRGQGPADEDPDQGSSTRA